MASTWPPTFSIDFIAKQLSFLRSPTAWLAILLCRRLITKDYSYTFDAGLLVVFILLWLINYVDSRYAWGKSRVMDWSNEVVVITGGSSGLGKVLADSYGMRGVSVAVLDVRPFKDQERADDRDNVKWYHTDVGDEKSVLEAKRKIEADVCSPISCPSSHLQSICCAL